MVEFTNQAGVRRFRRRIRQIDGVVNIRQSPGMADTMAVDFTIGFPFNPLVRDTQRDPSVTSSTVVIAEEDDVHQIKLRMPPVPKEKYSDIDATELARDAVPDTIAGQEPDIHPQPGALTQTNKEWWPHIEWSSFSSPVTIEEAANYIERAVPGYLELARERTRELRGEANG
jgi:hypothetical protein